MALSEKKLSQIGKMYAKTEAAEQRGSGVPDGQYVALPEKMELGESRNSGNAQVTITWKVMEGKHEGETQLDFNQCETEQNLSYLKLKCQVLGVELSEDANEWNDIFGEFTDKNKDLFNINVKTGKDGFTNVYVNGPSEYEQSEDGEKDNEKGDEKDEKEESGSDIDWDEFEAGIDVKVTDEDDTEFVGRLAIVKPEYIKVDGEDGLRKFSKTDVKAIEKVVKKKGGKK